MNPPQSGLGTELRRRAEGLGFDLVGLVDAGAYDASLPASQQARRAAQHLPRAGTIVLFGTGGSGFWRSIQAENGGDLVPHPDQHPIEQSSRARLGQLVAWLGRESVQALIAQPDDDGALDYLRLACMAGFGVLSPVMGLLLHRGFGSWVSLRGALLVEGAPFGAAQMPELRFDPCGPCRKPCVTACPAGVFDGSGGIDLEACADERLGGGCATGCDARRACPVGSEFRYEAAEEQFRHAYSLFAIQRWRD